MATNNDQRDTLVGSSNVSVFDKPKEVIVEVVHISHFPLSLHGGAWKGYDESNTKKIYTNLCEKKE